MISPLQADDVRYLLHHLTQIHRDQPDGPLVITRGDGIHVFDESGNRYIEAISGSSCAALGFDNARLVEAAARQMKKLPFYHSFANKSSDPTIALAAALIRLSPVPMSKVTFGTSGSDANDAAIKFAWAYHIANGNPQKRKIVSHSLSYHGSTAATASLTGQAHMHAAFGLPLPGFLQSICPSHYRFGGEGETQSEFVGRSLSSLEELIAREDPHTIAAFFAEPIMNAAGCIIPPDGYFAGLQEILRRHDILFVVDEVATAFGRTGQMFACQTFGLAPDMISLAKPLSAGYLPISALMINDRIHAALIAMSAKSDIFGHGFTYGGHPVCAAVALETLRIYEDLRITEHVRRVSTHFRQKLTSLAQHPLVGEVRTLGLFGGFDVVSSKETRKPFDPDSGLMAFLGKQMQRHGVITRWGPQAVNVCPPLIITEDQIDDLAARVKTALDDTLVWAEAKSAA